ncbi:MAG TPA: FtsX-like permease family protein, partial [Blastocatellia bacterium]|nr:FtsX-like permease family protein [Blastocatellia bacterium]
KDAQLPALMHDVEEKVRTLPGVKAASFSFLTFNQGVWTTPVFIQGADQSADGGTSIRNNVVGSDYFAAMGIPLVLGRTFGSEDTEKSHKVAVISESMANRYFPNGSPLGKRFSIGGPSNDENEIIGVVKDVKGMRLTEEWRETAYYVYTQRPQPLANFVVRFSGSPQSGITQVRNAIQGVNRNIAIDEVVGLSDYIGRSLVNQKLVAQLSSFFGFLALILACVGIYGVFSYSVVRRTNEIGIRMALGAQQCDVLRLVLRESLTLVLIGTAVGLLASMLVSKLATQAVSDLTFGVEPNDPVTIGLASSLLVAVAVFAGYLPARRATRIDPIAALREE